jgi:hypothetical protein
MISYCNFSGLKPRIVKGQHPLAYLMTNPILRAMFSASHTKLDMGTQLDAGKVIIINNSKAILGDEGAEFFGRFFVALIACAAQQRAGKPPSTKKPCYVYIDECQSVIAKDTRIPILLDECRSQKIALILAHQRTAQLTTPVLDAVANCAIRMANSDDDAKFLADKLRSSADILRSLPQGTFATFVRDLTPNGVQLRVAKTDLDSLPKMTEEELTAIRDHMRTAFSSPPPESKTEQPTAMSPSPTVAELPTQATEQHDAGEPAEDWALDEKIIWCAACHAGHHCSSQYPMASVYFDCWFDLLRPTWTQYSTPKYATLVGPAPR